MTEINPEGHDEASAEKLIEENIRRLALPLKNDTPTGSCNWTRRLYRAGVLRSGFHHQLHKLLLYDKV